jgi:hypothetical protein
MGKIFKIKVLNEVIRLMRISSCGLIFFVKIIAYTFNVWSFLLRLTLGQNRWKFYIIKIKKLEIIL